MFPHAAITFAPTRREFNRFATLFTRLRLNQLECRNLYQYFRTIDSDNSGRISMEEFRGKIK